MSTEHDVKVIRIKDVRKHDNADTLSITDVDGRPVIFKTTDFNANDLAVYIPVDAIVPDEARWSFLKGSRRIKAKKLRGVFSMGLLIKPEEHHKENDDVKEFYGITDFVENDVKLSTGGEFESDPGCLPKYTDIESIRKYKNKIDPDQEVILTEKIHGANARYIWSDDRLWVGSKSNIRRKGGIATFLQILEKPNITAEDPKEKYQQIKEFYTNCDTYNALLEIFKEHKMELNPYKGVVKFLQQVNLSLAAYLPIEVLSSYEIPMDIWWKSALDNDLEAKLKTIPDIALYGEVYGNVQDIKYNVSGVKFIAFDALDTKTNKYLDYDDFISLMEKLNIPTTPILFRGSYKDVDFNLANGKSVLGKNTCIREGFVLKFSKESYIKGSRAIFKLVGEDYLLR